MGSDSIDIPVRVGKHLTRVFTFRGKPINQPNTPAWRNAPVRANIQNFRWHDLRHTWASWLTQQGTPMNVLQELGGWESIEMVQRYAHLSTPQLGQHSEEVCLIFRSKRHSMLKIDHLNAAVGDELQCAFCCQSRISASRQRNFKVLDE